MLATEPLPLNSPQTGYEDKLKLLRTAFLTAALGMLGGCVAVPTYMEYAAVPPPYHGPTYYPPPVYHAPAYIPPPGYYGPAYPPPVYYGPAYYAPRYYGPSVGISIYGGSRGGHRHGGHYRRR